MKESLSEILLDIVCNPSLQTAVIAWFIAQAIKVITTLIKSKKFDFERFVGTGGMPSSHSAFVTSLAMSVGALEGFDSSLFGLSMVFALVVMYDAAGIRRAAGKQAIVLNQIVAAMEENDEIQVDKKLKELLGHTPIEVIAGALLGILVVMIRFY